MRMKITATAFFHIGGSEAQKYSNGQHYAENSQQHVDQCKKQGLTAIILV